MLKTLANSLHSLKRLSGFPEHTQHASEQLVASIGAVMAIVLVLALTRLVLGADASVLTIPSIGASAVLIFAIPHSVFAQPWSVLAGNVLSALVGVACYRLLGNTMMAAALAVGGAILMMHLARCIHPPGGATALLAVIGSQAIHDLGFHYVLYPTALNCVVMLVFATLFNSLFPWRRYPSSLMRYAQKPRQPGHVGVEEADIESAIASLNVLVDASPRELGQIIREGQRLALLRRDARLPQVQLGHFYCNDLPGQQWSVRQIIDERRSDVPERDLVIYKVVDGSGLHKTGSCTRLEFARWVSSELQPGQSHLSGK